MILFNSEILILEMGINCVHNPFLLHLGLINLKFLLNNLRIGELAIFQLV